MLKKILKEKKIKISELTVPDNENAMTQVNNCNEEMIKKIKTL